MNSKLVPQEIDYEKFPILSIPSKETINQILDEEFGEKICVRCKTKIMRTELIFVEQNQRGWCSECWKKQYGRTHKLGKRPRQFVEY